MSLDRDARDLLAAHGLTGAAWARWCFPRSRRWHGDSCGCTDDRCIGYHHDAHEPCGCLPALLHDFELRQTSRPPGSVAGLPSTDVNGPPAAS